MTKEQKILVNALSVGVLAISSYMLGKLRQQYADKKLVKKNAAAKQKEIDLATQKAFEEFDKREKDLIMREQVVNVKYSFCRCIAENMKQQGYKVNFFPEERYKIDPAVDRDYSYSIAVDAIGNSSMDPYHKDCSITGIRRGEDQEYYKAIIEIATSNGMQSVDKMQTILGL